MGVTYKAFDVDLQCIVTLKIIIERYLGDEIGSTSILREKPARRPASAIQMLPRSSTWAELGAVTSMRWSL